MEYWKLFEEENEAAAERHELAYGRICQMETEETVKEPYRSYFRRTAAFVRLVEQAYADQRAGKLAEETMEELEERNHRLYADILPENYENSYGNPAYAVRELGNEYGPLLSFLYAEMRVMIVCAYESRLMDMTIYEEIFIEIYNLFEGEEPDVKEVKDALYYFVSDYCDVTLTYRVREVLDPSLDFAKSIIMDSDLTDLRYLYRYGEYISDTEKKMAAFLNSLPEEKVRRMADAYSNGLLDGYKASGRDVRTKKTVQMRCSIGFERMLRIAIENFRRAGLEPVVARVTSGTMSQVISKMAGYRSEPVNRQYDYDHRFDYALYFDKAFKERKLEVLKVAYEKYKRLAAGYAGPAVQLTFGEESFQPVNKPEIIRMTEKQDKLFLTYSTESVQSMDEYIPGTETNFTIIAFPVPDIGENFEAIFDETLEFNTLDNNEYRQIQQIIIDELNQADHVLVRGRGKNRTNLKINIHIMEHPERETNFENCVADENIPLGEVFTSPRLTGTEGLLHVGRVYIGDVLFRDLELEFKDGRVCRFDCKNFENEEENRSLVKQMILKNHDWLPMGEFAIGTNTTAYEVGMRYGIFDKFPILIAEKMGPHFAVGDTCYCWQEDCVMYNPDGKLCVAKENEISMHRKEDPQKAYFSCHTDVTIPYAELDTIETVHQDGTKVAVIRGGRFALPGTEKLNEPLDRLGE